MNHTPGPIGIFDSGYGGLTILHGIRQLLPEYDYIYLGDNARAPYGSRSFEVVYQFTRQAVLKLFVPEIGSDRRVLGIIRPTVEVLGDLTQSRHVGVLATEGTIRSNSYSLEVAKFHPDIKVSGVACPLWAAIVEANEADSPGADYFVKKRIDQLLRKDPLIDTIILGCTHYPLLMNSIVRHVPPGVRIVPQGQYVAESLNSYLQRHNELDRLCTKGGTCQYLTTESEDKFRESAQIFLHESVNVKHVDLD